MWLKWLLLLLAVSLASTMRKMKTRDSGRLEVRLSDLGNNGVLMRCIANLDQVITSANWSKDGQSLRSSERVVVSEQNLTIRMLEPEDEGLYRCDSSDPYPLTSELKK